MLGGERKEKYMNEYGLSEYDANVLTKNKKVSDYFEECIKDKCDPKIITSMHIDHAYTIDEALAKARKIVGENKKITIIPDGISVIF